MVVHCVSVIVLTIYISTLIWGISAQNSGPYEVVLEILEDCADKGSGEIKVTSTARTDENGKVLLSGDLSLPYGVNDNMKADGNAMIADDGRWKPIGLVWKLSFAKACTSMKRMSPIWFNIFKSANVDNPTCAIAEGTYHFVDYRITGKVGGMTSLRYGKYRVQLNFFRKNQKIGCLSYTANLVPKR